MPRDTKMIEINLNAHQTPPTHVAEPANFIGNISLGRGAQTLPYMDSGVEQQHDIVDEDSESWTTGTLEDSKPALRFYAIGPRTYRVICPLCKQRARTETVQMTGALGQLSCLLSAFSCCFPIFSLSLVYMCMQSRLKSKRVFCSSCGGHLGYYWRPT